MGVRVDNVGLVAVLLLTTLLLLSLPHATDAKASGPPVPTRDTLCSDMTPGHGGTSQTSEPPYTITTPATCYTPGQAVTVTLSGNDNSQFRGFFLQARKPDNNMASYGTFDVNGNSAAQTLDCFAQNQNAVGHNSGDDKSTSSFQWTSPSDLTGDVEFVATVVQTRLIYWVAAVKKTIQPCSSADVTSPGANTTTSMSTTVAGQDMTTSTSPSNAAGMFLVNSLLLLLLAVKLVVRRA